MSISSIVTKVDLVVDVVALKQYNSWNEKYHLFSHTHTNYATSIYLPLFVAPESKVKSIWVVSDQF